MSTRETLLTVKPPSPGERPLYVNHPAYLTCLIYTVTAIVTYSVAFGSRACGDFDSDPGTAERRNETVCVISLGIIAPFTVAGVAAAFINCFGNRYAARYGVRSTDLIVEGGGD